MTIKWVEVSSLGDIPSRGARCVNTPEGRIAVFRTAEGQVFAIEDHCPHKGGPLSQGIVHGTRVSCPLHDWTVELETGIAVAPDEGGTVCYPVRIEDETVLVELP